MLIQTSPLLQYAQLVLARNHCGPTSVKSRKCWWNLKTRGSGEPVSLT